MSNVCVMLHFCLQKDQKWMYAALISRRCFDSTYEIQPLVIPPSPSFSSPRVWRGSFFDASLFWWTSLKSESTFLYRFIAEHIQTNEHTHSCQCLCSCACKTVLLIKWVYIHTHVRYTAASLCEYLWSFRVFSQIFLSCTSTKNAFADHVEVVI